MEASVHMQLGCAGIPSMTSSIETILLSSGAQKSHVLSISAVSQTMYSPPVAISLSAAETLSTVKLIQSPTIPARSIRRDKLVWSSMDKSPISGPNQLSMSYIEASERSLSRLKNATAFESFM